MQLVYSVLVSCLSWRLPNKCLRGVVQIVVDGCYVAINGLHGEVADLQDNFNTANQQTKDDQGTMRLAVADNDEELQLTQLEI